MPYLLFKTEHYIHSQKVWAHRVNSIEKLKHTQEKYEGIELDLVFDTITNTFDVNHPPAISINLTLDEFLEELNKDEIKGVWLDFKNLNENNSIESFRRLEHLVKKHDIAPNKIIIESQHPEFLQIFSDSDFKTSYYLPSALYQLSKKKLKLKIAEIQKNINQYPTTAISTNINDYSIIKQHFPSKVKYLWSIDKIYTTRMFKNYFQTRKTLRDPKVEVLLIRVNSKKGNR
ncbi:MAG: DUF2181 domain-containing protein [Flavobacteriaceae bacterium]